ncbi:MAG: hypothetical protein Tsb0010_02140 [Parvularculaceae bacterium]
MVEVIAKGDAIRAAYEIRALTGTVTATETRSETEVKGDISGGGGFSVSGTGGTAPVSGKIESKTTRFQNIFMTDDEGGEHAIELVNFLVPCKEGQKLTLFQLVMGGSPKGYFHAFNHNTKNHYEKDGAVSKAMFPTLVFGAVVAVLAIWIWNSASGNPGNGSFEVFAMTFIGAGLGGVVLYGIAKIFAGVRAAKVHGNPAYKSFLSGLAAQSKEAA